MSPVYMTMENWRLLRLVFIEEIPLTCRTQNAQQSHSVACCFLTKSAQVLAPQFQLS